jgi:BlaI family penicillinase repressor
MKDMEKLTQQEEEVMKCVWKLNGGIVRDIMKLLSEPKPPYTTVASVFINLKKKNYVKLTRQKNAYYYIPLITDSEYKSEMMKSFVKDYFSSSFKDMVMYFTKKHSLSADDLNDIISEIEKNNKK